MARKLKINFKSFSPEIYSNFHKSCLQICIFDNEPDQEYNLVTKIKPKNAI